MYTIVKNLIKFLFYINLLIPALATNCNLQFLNKQWDDEWRLLLTKTANHKYELLRDGSVAIDSQLYMICQKDPKLKAATCQQRGIFDINLPANPKCKEGDSVKPVRITGQDNSCKYTLYKIGFNVQIDSKTEFYETYRVCFDHKNVRPLFTINTAYPVAGGRPDTLKFNTDDIFFGQLFQAFTRSATFARFQKLLGEKQPYMNLDNTDHIIDRGHLTPSADFATTNLKRSTFNLINVIPQFKTVDNGNWRLIEEWSRHPSRTPARICTGVLDCNLNSDKLEDLNCILQLKHVNGQMVPMFLVDNRRVPIPLWSYKIVKNTVFLTYNNIYDNDQRLKPPRSICAEVSCPLGLRATIKDGRTFCCNYSLFLNRAVPYLKGVC